MLQTNNSSTICVGISLHAVASLPLRHYTALSFSLPLKTPMRHLPLRRIPRNPIIRKPPGQFQMLISLLVFLAQLPSQPGNIQIPIIPRRPIRKPHPLPPAILMYHPGVTIPVLHRHILKRCQSSCLGISRGVQRHVGVLDAGTGPIGRGIGPGTWKWLTG